MELEFGLRRLIVVLAGVLLVIVVSTPYVTVLFDSQRTLPASSVTVVRNGDELHIQGNIAKDYSGPILFGQYTFSDDNSSVYYVRQFNYSIIYGELYSTESAESDVCLVMLAHDQVTTLSSGGEMLCAHQSHVGNGPGSVSNVTVPGQGFALRNGYKLNIGSVSQLYPNQVTAARLDSNFLSLSFSLTMLVGNNNGSLGTFSERSPFRDREFVPDGSREYAPYTNFVNNQSSPVEVYSVGVFLSSISHFYQNQAAVEVWKNQALVLSQKMFVHDVRYSDSASSRLIPLNLTLNPGDIISVRGRVAANISQVYDFVSFIMTSNSLARVNETSLFPGYADLNGDGYPDYMDYDVQGTIWADITRPNLDGAHDTQFPWARLIPEYSSIGISDKSASLVTILTYNRACLNLERNEAIVHYQFVIHYCNEENVTQPSPGDRVVWGDFTGDGFLDRLRIDPSNSAFYVALGGPAGLAKESLWFTLGRPIDKLFVEHDPSSDRDVVNLETGGMAEAFGDNGTNAFVQIAMPYLLSP